MAAVNTSENILDIRRRIIMNSPHTETVTSDIASFDTDMSAKLKSCKLKFLPIQNGSGDPSPTNKRRIVGLTSIKYRKTGRNLANVVSYSGVSQNMETASKTTNNYGTTLSTTEFTAPHGEVTITQSTWPDSNSYSYRNGYFTVQVHNLEYGKMYNMSFKVSDITNNPLNINAMYMYGPNGSGGTWGTMIGDRMVFNNISFNQPSNGNFRKQFEIRNCGMSFTMSDFMVTTVDDEDPTWEPYVGIEDRIMIPPKGKNLGNIIGFSASAEEVYAANTSSILDLTGNYGNTISTTDFDPDGSLTITQTQSPQSNLPHYRNGYFVILADNVEYGKEYKVSFDVDEIISNPLNATLANIQTLPASGSAREVLVDGNRVYTKNSIIYNANATVPYRHGFDIRNCGMSLKMSHFMITDGTETDQTYEPYIFGAYGGYIDLVSGEIVSEWNRIKLRWGDMTLQGENTNTIRKTYDLSPYGMNGEEYSMCNIAPYLYSNNNDNNHYYISSNGSTLYVILDNTIDDDFEFEICYKTTTPTRTLIDPESLKALRGANAIWTDSNDETSVTYYTH